MCIAILPSVLISIIIAIFFNKSNKKGTAAVIAGAIILLCIFFIFPGYIAIFFQNIADILKNLIEYVTTKSYFQIIVIYKWFSLSSWLILFNISLILAGCLANIMYKEKQLKNVGIDNFDGSIAKMNENGSNNNLYKEPENKTLIGTNKSGKSVFCDDKAKHIFVCGTTGSGKTVLLSNFIESGLSKDYGMLIVDGKGDIDDGSLLYITKQFADKYHKKLYIVDLNNPEQSIKYNPFMNCSETICKDMLINMTDWSEEHYKRNTERYLQRLLKLLKLHDTALSFEHIISNISASRFEELSSVLSKEQKISKEEHLLNIELIKASAKIAENASARFSTIAESDIGTIFDKSGIDIFTALNENAIILFVLNPLIYPELSSTMGRLILIDAKKAISKMFGQYNKRKFFIFDEINVYASTVLIDLINKSRSAGVTAIPATQSLADLEAAAGEPFKQQIIENCNNYVVLRQNSSKSAEEWAKTLGTKETMQVTFQIDKSKPTEVGSARKTREFIVHPDEIKSLQTGKGIFLSRDIGKCERIKVRKPF
jgi:type IV secretory pathway TraG/TraD family ATPase VirD4